MEDGVTLSRRLSMAGRKPRISSVIALYVVGNILVQGSSVCIHVGIVDDIVLIHWGRDRMATIFPDDIFKCIFLNENLRIWIRISLKVVPWSPIDN